MQRGPKNRTVKFTRTLLAKPEFQTPQNGKKEELISDAETPYLKLRLRHDGKPAWYTIFSHPKSHKKIKKKICDITENNHPERVRDLAREIRDDLIRARHFATDAASFDNRDITVPMVVEEYINRLEAGSITRAKPTSAKTLEGYRKDLKHIQGAYNKVRAVDLSGAIIEHVHYENVQRCRNETNTRIQRYEEFSSEKAQKILNAKALGLTPRNVRCLRREIDEIEDRVEVLFHSTKTGHSQNRNSYALIRAAFRALCGAHGFPIWETDFNVQVKKFEQQHRSLTLAEIKSLTTHCRDILASENSNVKDHASLVMCLLYSGARKTELMTADVSTLTRSSRKVSIKCPNNKEKNETKEVIFIDQAEPFLAHLVGDRQSGPLFTRTNFPDTAVRKIAKDAGVENWTGFHALRHSFASLCQAAGLSIPEIAAHLGQSSLSVTQTYGYLFDEEKVASMNKVAEKTARLLS